MTTPAARHVRRRRVSRPVFAIAFAVLLLLFWLVVQSSLAALPWMAEVLAPRGINAGFALNLIWLAAGGASAAAMMVLVARRMRDRGRSAWWAPAAVLPLAALALLNDAIFLVSRSFVLPAIVQWPLAIAAVGIALWVLAECLLGPSRDSADATRR